MPTASALPRGLAGTWTCLDQGSAEAMYEIHEDGTYRRARVLMQSRSSGTFTFSIGDAGTVRVKGTTLTVAPSRGAKSLSDPDSPSSNYRDRPLTDLEPGHTEGSESRNPPTAGRSVQRVSEPVPDISARTAARPASSRAMGTRGGEQET